MDRVCKYAKPSRGYLNFACQFCDMIFKQKACVEKIPSKHIAAIFDTGFNNRRLSETLGKGLSGSRILGFGNLFFREK